MLVWAVFSKTVRFDRSIGLAALLCFLFFLVLPFRVFGSAFADMRLLPYAMAIALVAIAPVRHGSKVLMAASAIALALFAVCMTATSKAYIALDRQVQAAVPALTASPPLAIAWGELRDGPQLERVVRLVPVQEDGDARNRDVGGDQGIQQQLPPRQLPQAMGHPVQGNIPNRREIHRHDPSLCQSRRPVAPMPQF